MISIILIYPRDRAYLQPFSKSTNINTEYILGGGV